MFLLDKYLFYELIEHTINNNNFLPDDKKNIYKNLLLTVNVKNNHFKYFKLNIYNNIFTEQTLKDECLEIFSKSQFYLKSFEKCLRQYRYKRLPLLNDMDFVSLSKIDTCSCSCIILDKNVKYAFKISDLIKIINNSLLSKIDYFYPDPKEIKNPYNNLSFDKSTLYNIYFNIKNSKIIMPTLFHLYMIEGFNISNFLNNHEILLRDTLIKKYIDSINDIRLIMQMKRMFKDDKIIGISNKKRFKLIHRDVCNFELLKVFKPFVKTYLYVIYTLNSNKKLILKNRLYKKISGFFLENPQFGRKFQNSNNPFIFGVDKNIITYNLKIKNNYNLINIEHITIPSFIEWTGVDAEDISPVPYTRLLPNNNLMQNNVSTQQNITQHWSQVSETESDSNNDNEDSDYSLFVNSLIHVQE
tara:strand:+ start:559 stop:1800 length:1242 start_codon:yes stop_codon:yes gene_type:complete